MFCICICISISIGIYVYLSQEESEESEESETSASAYQNFIDIIWPTSTPASTLKPAYVPFNAGSQTHTDANDRGNGSSIFLEKHNVNCGSKALNQLQLAKPTENQIQWKYTCADGGKLGSRVVKSTPRNLLGNGNTIFLDRHDADCGTDNVMTQIQLVRPTENQIQWKYTCAPSTQSQKLNCRQVTTDTNDDGGGDSTFLDKHDIKCNSNEAISRLRLNRTNDKNYQFEYTCCS